MTQTGWHIKWLFLLIFSFLFTTCRKEEYHLPQGIFAEMQTNKGSFTIQLFYKETPFSAAHFITLAEGDNPFVQDSLRGIKYYDMSRFFEANDTYIAGGDPKGDGSSSPGYFIEDEYPEDRTGKLLYAHDTIGRISWLRDEYGQNGASFAIFRNYAHQWDRELCVFATVIRRMEIIDSLDKGDTLYHVKIIRNGKEARKFDARKTLKEKLTALEKKLQEFGLEKKKDLQRINFLAPGKRLYFKNLKKSAIRLPNGLQIAYLDKKHHHRPSSVDSVDIHYSEYLPDGKLIRTNDSLTLSLYKLKKPRIIAPAGTRPLRVQYNRKMPVIQGIKEAVLGMSPGDKAVLYIPYYLAYGLTGNSRIPPEQNLIYVIELSKPDPSFQKK